MNLIKQNRWTPEEDKLLVANYGIIPIIELENLLNRTENAIRQRHRNLVPRNKKTLSEKTKVKHWNAQDDKYLKKNYGYIPTKEIARHLNRTTDSIKVRANQQGLKFTSSKSFKVTYKTNGSNAIKEISKVIANSADHAEMRVRDTLENMMKYKNVVIIGVYDRRQLDA